MRKLLGICDPGFRLENARRRRGKAVRCALIGGQAIWLSDFIDFAFGFSRLYRCSTTRESCPFVLQAISAPSQHLPVAQFEKSHAASVLHKPNSTTLDTPAPDNSLPTPPKPDHFLHERSVCLAPNIKPHSPYILLCYLNCFLIIFIRQ